MNTITFSGARKLGNMKFFHVCHVCISVWFRRFRSMQVPWSAIPNFSSVQFEFSSVQFYLLSPYRFHTFFYKRHKVFNNRED